MLLFQSDLPSQLIYTDSMGPILIIVPGIDLQLLHILFAVCVGFNPHSDTDYSIAEICQSFYNTQGSHVETPLVNLDIDTCYDCNY